MFTRLLPAAFVAMTAVPALAGTVSVETAIGAVDVPQAPEKVAAFDVSVVDTLDALGVKVSGTVNSLYVDYLDHVVAEAEDLGTFWEPDMEGIHALKPGLIVVGTRSADQVDAMGKIAPSIDMTTGVTNDIPGEAIDRLEAFGEIFGRQDEAAALKATFEGKLAAAKAAADGKGNALIIMTNGPKISAYGANGRFGWLHSALGLPEASAEIGASTHGETVSFEFIKDANPDWLIVVDRLAAIGRDGESAQATLDNALVQDTKAWKSGQVIYLNAADIYIAGGGIQSMYRTLDALTAAYSAGS